MDSPCTLQRRHELLVASDIVQNKEPFPPPVQNDLRVETKRPGKKVALVGYVEHLSSKPMSTCLPSQVYSTLQAIVCHAD